MPSLEPTKLIELFDSLESAKNVKSKSDILIAAKYYIFNEMNDDQIRAFFVLNPKNFENLFVLNIWTKSLDENNGIVEFLEPYDIIDKIFNCLHLLPDFVDSFHQQVIFLLNQNKDEKSKHICVKHFIRLVQSFDLNGVENPIQAKNDLEMKLKSLLLNFVREIPNTAISYTQQLAELFSALTVRLNNLEAKLLNEQQRVHVFSCSIFDDNNDLLKELDRISKLNSVQNFRVFEIIVRLGCISYEHLVNICENKFYISKLLNLYLNDKSDILSQLNCIELITYLVETSHGYEFIEKTGQLNHLINYLSNLDSDPFSELLTPSIVKFFAKITKERYTQVKEHYPRYYEYLFRSASNENLVKNLESINLSIETFNFLFEQNLPKKFIIENYENEFLILLDRLIWIIKNSINEKLKINSLKCLTELISPDPFLLEADKSDEKLIVSPWITPEWSHFARSIYEKITSKISHENLFNMCLNLGKEPFAEKRQAAKLYFKALAQTDWGLLALFTPNKFNCEEIFLDGYLLNRSIELEKHGLESKYELIKLIGASLDLNPSLINIIGEVAHEKLKQYAREGPFFSRTQSQVAFENA